MRNLTKQEAQELKVKNDAFFDFCEEILSILGDFAERLGLKDPAMIVSNPDFYLSDIDRFLERLQIDEEDFAWIAARVGYFIGEIIVARLDGCWFVNDIPDSRYFARYLVGQFSKGKRNGSMIDPLEAAVGFLVQPPPRTLTSFIKEIEVAC